MATYFNPSATASSGPSIKAPDYHSGIRERTRLVSGTHRLLSGAMAQDYTGNLRRWALKWTGLTNAEWAVVKAYIQGGYQLYWQGPEMSAKVAVIVEDVDQVQRKLNGDTATAPHWDVQMVVREATLTNAIQYVFGSASITLGALTLAGTGTFAPVVSGLLTSLVSYWTLEEASGTRVDSVTASGNDLTDNNTVTQAAGKVGNAAQFTIANNESLSHADNASLSTGDIDFTVACWVYADSLANYPEIVSKWGTALGILEYRVMWNSSRFSFWVSSDGSVYTSVVANNLGAPSTATWYFLVAWHDSVANTINIQVNNGTVDSAAWSTGVFDSSTAFMIGNKPASGDSGDRWGGRIDEVGFWKRVLTATERTNLYNAGAGVTYPFTGVP